MLRYAALSPLNEPLLVWEQFQNSSFIHIHKKSIYLSDAMSALPTTDLYLYPFSGWNNYVNIPNT